jgi:uncharacterized protein (TIGR04222 family)
LALALVLIGAIVFAGRAFVARLDRSRALPTPSFPERLDPIDVAFLRSGRGDVLRTAIVHLQSKGLVVIQDRMIARVPIEPAEPLGAIETAVLAALDEPKYFGKLAKAVGPVIAAPLAARETSLVSEQMIFAPSARTAARAISAIGVIGLIAIELFAIAQLAHHHAEDDGGSSKSQFVGIVLLGIGGLVVWLKSISLPRTTDRGRRYLTLLTGGFPAESLKPYVVSHGAMAAAGADLGAGTSRPGFAPATALLAAPLLVGLYGIESLVSTPLSDASVAMRPRKPDGSGGCSMSFDGGGSCGCCGGGSCGGSCGGGCGGGGCGGGGCGGG